MTTTPKGPTMPTDPAHRALLRAIDGLTTQVRRIADTLETPVTTDDDGAQTTGDDTPAAPAMPYKMCSASAEGAFGGLLGPCILRYQHYGPLHQDADGSSWAQRVAVPDTQSAAEWKTTAAVYSGLHSTAEDEVKQLRAELAGATAAIKRVRAALDDRPALCTDSVYERGWSDAAEMVRNAFAGPTTEG